MSNSFAQSSPGGISSDLTLWLDVKDSVQMGGLPATNGGTIDRWVNKTINLGCPNLNQTTAAERPTYRTNELNFNPIVEFDDVNDHQLERNVLGSDIFNQKDSSKLCFGDSSFQEILLFLKEWLFLIS